MPRLSIFVKALRDLRWQVFWYGVGLAAMGALVVYVYPSYSDQLADFEIPEALKAFIGEADYASPAGFLSAEFFSWAPILLVIFAIMAGTSALAGEEAAGTMDLLLAQPVSRRQIVLEKLAGFMAASVGIAALVCLGWLLSLPFVDIDMSLGKMIVATFNMLPLTFFFGAFAMWSGSALPNRRVATGLVTALAVVTYFVNFLANLVEVLRPLRWASPFFYDNGTNVLPSGVDWSKVTVLLGLFCLFTVLTLLAFERRDVGVLTEGPIRLRLGWPRARAGRPAEPRTSP